MWHRCYQYNWFSYRRNVFTQPGPTRDIHEAERFEGIADVGSRLCSKHHHVFSLMLVSPFRPKNARGAALSRSRACPAEGLGVLVYKLFDRRVTRPALSSESFPTCAHCQSRGTCAPTSFMNRSFMNMKSGTNARQRTNLPCTVHLRSLEFRWTRNVLQVWRCDYAGSEASFETKACDESGTGVGGCRVDFFASGGRIGIGHADSGHSADTEHVTGSRNHPR